jgi:methionyl-tRNA synthetase
MRNNDVMERKAVLATGTDEHGIKIQKVAEESKESPRDLCDRVSQKFKELAGISGVEYTRFIRTTDLDHVEAVKKLWNDLQKGGFIYKGTHEGWYSVSDEAFYTPAQIKVNDSDSSKMESIETGSTVEWSSEENYKFKLSAFQQPLLDWLDANPDAVVPASRRDTLIAEIKQGLSDLSVSRPRSRLHWGIPVPSDEQHTIYVWLDALTNYLTVSGYPWKDGKTECWPTDVQMIGKDIIRFHAVYFPAFLMALGLPLPVHTVVHGHWTMDKHKMSKSRGNVADPFQTINKYGRDQIRWFLCRVGGNLAADAGEWREGETF